MNKPAKAMIMNLDTGERFICHFNPKDYRIQKQNHWSTERVATTNVPQAVFGGGQPATMQMQLLFDTYTKPGPGGSATDVRKVFTDAIARMMIVDEKLRDKKNDRGRPPFVRFMWGATWSFNAVITSVNQHFTLFTPDGTPVRAVLDVTFQQVEDESLPKQNPTSGGESAQRLWTVKEGDTLAWIAHNEYGDATQWRPLADANRLTQVRRLTPGMTLVIPHA